MVDTQVRPSDVTKFPIIDAMLRVPRELYVPAALREAAYVGENLDLGGGRVLLEPRTLAKMLDAVDLRAADVVLDLGCGLGYSTAVIARMVKAVVGIEDDAVRAEDAQATLLDQGVDNAAVIAGPLAEGAPKHGPYDAMFIEGGVGSIPDTIVTQLKEGGRIAAIFMDRALGSMKIGQRRGDRIDWRFDFNAGAPILKGFEAKRAFAL